MYEIWSSAGLIRHPLIRKDDRTVTVGKLSLELNKAGSLAFTMPPVHHCFNELKKLSTECWVVRDDEEIFRGRVLYSDRNLINQREVFCEGLRVLLNDEYLRPGDLSSNGTYSGTAAGLIDLLCAAYNARQPDAVPFARGTVDVSGTVTAEAKDWQTIGETLDKAVEMYGGFVFVRRVNGQNLIDWTLDSGPAGEQHIRFGDNLLTLQEHITGEDVFTVVIPLGKDRGEGAGRLTIEQAAASGGKDYIENSAAIAELGVRIAKVVTFDDIDDPDVLYTTGAAVFQQGGGVLTSMELSVVDLHDAGVDVERLRLGNYYSVDSPPHSIALQMPLVKMDIDLLRPDYSSAFTFGIQMNGMVERQNTVVKQVAATAGEAKKKADAAATPAMVDAAIAASEARTGDYIEETDTDGNWTWIKWHSGWAECWRDSNHTVAANSLTQKGNVYMIDVSRSYPSGLFTAAPQLWANAGHTGGSTKYEFWCGCDKNQTSSTANYTICRHEQQPAQATLYVNLWAKGKWK